MEGFVGECTSIVIVGSGIVGVGIGLVSGGGDVVVLVVVCVGMEYLRGVLCWSCISIRGCCVGVLWGGSVWISDSSCSS